MTFGRIAGYLIAFGFLFLVPVTPAWPVFEKCVVVGIFCVLFLLLVAINMIADIGDKWLPK